MDECLLFSNTALQYTFFLFALLSSQPRATVASPVFKHVILPVIGRTLYHWATRQPVIHPEYTGHHLRNRLVNRKLDIWSFSSKVRNESVLMWAARTIKSHVKFQINTDMRCSIANQTRAPLRSYTLTAFFAATCSHLNICSIWQNIIFCKGLNLQCIFRIVCNIFFFFF